MTTTVTSRPIRLTFALVVTPVMRWAIAVHSVPDGQAWRSACTCGQSLWNGRFIATGRCTGYGQQIGAPPYTVEAADLRAAVALALSVQTGWAMAAYALRPRRCWRSPPSTWPPRITAATTAGFLGLLTVESDERWPRWCSPLASLPGPRHAWTTRKGRRDARGTDRRRLGLAQLAGRLHQDPAGLQSCCPAGDHAAPHRPSATWHRPAARAIPDRRCRDRPGPTMTTAHQTWRRP
jgi:hypothetical protein